jgi:hypothetical protein
MRKEEIQQERTKKPLRLTHNFIPTDIAECVRQSNQKFRVCLSQIPFISIHQVSFTLELPYLQNPQLQQGE